MYTKRVKEAIEAIKNGEMIIIMDDEDRENEGDLVFAGIFSTPEKINFMAQEARGLICVSIQQDLADSLEFPPMVSTNNSNHQTAFTVSIDAKEATTGISAFERDMTIKLMCDTTSSPSDFVRPGHIFPLIAKEGGVLVRTGHTEASVDICKLAGLAPIGVICEIMKDDGSMARRGDKFLFDFAKKHNLKILYVSDLVQYRIKHENLITQLESTTQNLAGHKTKKHTFKDHLDRTHFVFEFSHSGVPLIKFHSINTDLSLLEEGLDGLLKSIEMLELEGGYIVFLDQDKAEQKIEKDFGIGAQILKILGIDSFKLISNKKHHFVALSGFELNIVENIEI